MKIKFKNGDRVQISKDHFWAKLAKGTIRTVDQEMSKYIRSEYNPARTVMTLKGPKEFYWVDFDEPQNDSSADGPYRGGEIDEDYLIKM